MSKTLGPAVRFVAGFIRLSCQQTEQVKSIDAECRADEQRLIAALSRLR